ncbi:hypothetical protein APD10_09245 [Acinetobacter baumannii]|nr:hypothetical protein APD10_09245 [Acinetobacter baumannii]
MRGSLSERPAFKDSVTFSNVFPIQELIPIPVMTTRSILISIKTTKIDLNNQVPFWNWQNISIFIIFSHQI